ncbi:MAG TPA: hypothetical protein VG650_16530 [Mycobacteriales bacterium]|nr:hypothetical protein [Mycobacteriales bacterium]
MIIAVASDKGSPGASTLSLLMGICWPGDRVVVELDACGADLPYRVAGTDGQPLAASPTITTLAVDSRPGAAGQPLLRYAQVAGCGVPLVVGETSAARFTRIASHLPAVVDVLAAAPETVIVDLGRLSSTSPVLSCARSAAVTVLVSHADTSSLGHLRERVEDLAAELGGSHRLRTPLAVVVRADRRDAHAAEVRVSKLLASVGSPTVVLGVVPDDAPGVAALHTGAVSRRVSRSSLFTAAREVVARLRATWPELTETTAPVNAPEPQTITSIAGVRQ